MAGSGKHDSKHEHDLTASIAGAAKVAVAIALPFACIVDVDNADDEDDNADDDADAVAGDSFLTSRKTSSAITDCNCAGDADADGMS